LDIALESSHLTASVVPRVRLKGLPEEVVDVLSEPEVVIGVVFVPAEELDELELTALNELMYP